MAARRSRGARRGVRREARKGARRGARREDATFWTFYHYTNRRGARGISQDQLIRGHDCDGFGYGVFMTTWSLKHGHSKEQILKNNWGRGERCYSDCCKQKKGYTYKIY